VTPASDIEASRASWAQRDRGATIPFVALLLVVLICCTAFAVDLGRQMLLRRDLQADADLIALDLSRHIDGRNATQLEIARTTSGNPVYLTFHNAAQENGIDAAKLTVTWGVYNPGTDIFTAQNDPVDAVQVTAADTVDYYFASAIGFSQNSAARVAVAAQLKEACFSVGSFALGVSSQQSALLNPLLNDALNLGLVGYEGLASADIVLDDLAAELGLGTVNDVATSTVTLQDFYLATAQVLSNQGDVANATLVQSIALTSQGSATFAIGDLIDLTTAGPAALSSSFNVLSLVSGAAFLANGTNALAVPALALNVGTIAQGTTTLEVIESPQQACGTAGAAVADCATSTAACAETSQLHLDQALAGDVNIAGLPGPLNNLAAVTGTLTLDSAEATATLTQILCPSPEGIDVTTITALLQSQLQLQITILGLTVDVTVSTSPPTTTSVGSIRIPPMAYGDIVETGTGTVGLSGAAVNISTSGALSGLASALLAPLGGVNFLLGQLTGQIVNPLISSLDAALLGPLTQLFGLNIAGADIAALPQVNCDPPLLRK
jgi:uncharacterized membrane protein